MKKPVVILLHIGYWIMYLLLLSLLMLCLMVPALQKGVHPHIGEVLPFLFAFAILPGMVSFYTFYTVLFRKYLSKRNIPGLIGSGILTVVVSAVIGSIIMTGFAALQYGPGVFNDGWASAITLTIVISIGTFANGIIGLVMKGFVTSYSDIKLKEELNKKNYEMELALVKSQINPHFLFNTINNIDVLITKDAVKASDYLNKLSDIMRFMLYETKTEKIPLVKELSYIEKYIALQKIRTSNPAYVNYSVEGSPEKIVIAPMLFIPFIENCFKHAEDKKTENAIDIKIVIEKEMIIFECNNHFNDDLQSKLDHSGLGNELIRKRLQLLYPGKHTLEISDKNNIYKVKLILHAD